MAAAVIAPIIVFVLVLIVLARTIRIVPQARAGVVERFGRYSRTLSPGLTLVVPFIDRMRSTIDLREQVVSFPPQPVITEDNLVVSIDSVIYFQVTDAKAATYEIANYIQAIEQLTVTTLRNVIGGLALEKTLTSRDEINGQLRGVLDDATGKWGIRVNRVELKAIDPPASIQDSMEKQMRADREKRATILQAEGARQSQILQAEGQKQSAILQAEGEKQAAVLRAEGQAKAIETVFAAIHEGKPDAELLAYQYLQTLPQIAQGEANKIWIIPSELQQMVGKVAGTITGSRCCAGSAGDGREEARVGFCRLGGTYAGGRGQTAAAPRRGRARLRAQGVPCQPRRRHRRGGRRRARAPLSLLPVQGRGARGGLPRELEPSHRADRERRGDRRAGRRPAPPHRGDRPAHLAASAGRRSRRDPGVRPEPGTRRADRRAHAADRRNPAGDRARRSSAASSARTSTRASLRPSSTARSTSC